MINLGWTIGVIDKIRAHNSRRQMVISFPLLWIKNQSAFVGYFILPTVGYQIAVFNISTKYLAGPMLIVE